MSDIQTRSTLADLGKRGLGPMFEDVFEQNLIKYEGRDIASKIFAFLNTDKLVLRTTGLTGVPVPAEFAEGTPFPESVNIKTFETKYSINDYGMSIAVTDDCLKDRERLGKKLDEMAQLSKAQDIGEVKSAFQILNGGFVSTAKVNGTTLYRYNNEPLFSATHARADGGTSQSNVSAGAIALTELNLETGRLALIKQLTDIGLPILDMGAIMLVVPDDLIKNAVIFTQSQYRATTTNNDLNFYSTTNGRINAIGARWLNSNVGGSSTAWFLTTSLPGMDPILRVYRNGGPEYQWSERDAKTWNRTAAVKNRYACGNSEWKGTWASAGQ